MDSAPAPGGAQSHDPARVETLGEFAAALQRLRGPRSYAELDRAINPDHGRGPDVLPRATLSDLLRARSMPSRTTVLHFLVACGLDDEAREPWLAAWERVGSAHLRRPAGSVRVREARPRLLGVHACIRAGDAAGELPPYVERDLDVELRAAVGDAARDGGLVLLVGSSSVGKTRSLFAAVRAVLPEWWLIHPDPDDATPIRDLAAEPAPRTVVWLDELQRYLARPNGLTVAAVRRLIGGGLVLVGTLWPDEYAHHNALRSAGAVDDSSEGQGLLRLARTFDVADTISPAERRRAEALAADGRIRIALSSPDVGFTQVLAAGPDLIRRWEHAADPYGKAVITAAVEARRLGVRGPVTRAYLVAAAPAFLGAAQLAAAPAGWFGEALRYATTPVQGAAAALTPVAAGIGNRPRYQVADFLYQHGRGVRRCATAPEAVWQALLLDPEPTDSAALADSARRRGQHRVAVSFYEAAEAQGHRFAADWLVLLLTDLGLTDELRRRAEAGDGQAAGRMYELWKEHGEAVKILDMIGAFHKDRLRSLGATAERLSTEPERLGRLRADADAGDPTAAEQLAELETEWSRLDELLLVLDQRVNDGDTQPVMRLMELLVEAGRYYDSSMIRFRFTIAGQAKGKVWLAEQFVMRERFDIAIDLFREKADEGHANAARRLVDLLVDRNLVAELRQRADAGDRHAAGRLAEVELIRQGRTGEAVALLRDQADAGDRFAARRLADLLADLGDLDQLRRRSDTGDWHAAVRLARLLEAADRRKELADEVAAGTLAAFEALCRLGAGPDGRRAQALVTGSSGDPEGGRPGPGQGPRPGR